LKDKIKNHKKFDKRANEINKKSNEKGPNQNKNIKTNTNKK
jgi:hypothetical protein